MDQSDADTIEFVLTNSFADSFFSNEQDPLTPVFGSATHIGLVRAENQDHFAIMERSRSQKVLKTNMPEGDLPELVEKAHVLVVADGMGGRAFGKLASRLAIRTVWELAGQASNWIMKFTDLDSLEVHARLKAYAERVQKEFLDKGIEEPKYSHMGTTWTSAYIVQRDVLIAHLGDSRAYLWNGDSLCQITRDQTLAQDYIDDGVPAESVQQFRHVLTSCFGGNNDEVNLDFSHVRIREGNVLLLTTDGVTDVISDLELAYLVKTISKPVALCDRIVERVLELGAPDNLTLIAARF